MCHQEAVLQNLLVRRFSNLVIIVEQLCPSIIIFRGKTVSFIHWCILLANCKHTIIMSRADIPSSSRKIQNTAGNHQFYKESVL